MILLDANLLLYAVNADAPGHAKVKAWMEETFAGRRGTVLLSWFTLVAFVRIATNPKAFENPFPPGEALGIINEWLALPGVEIITPGVGHVVHFEAACLSANATGNLVTDAHLAALAMENGCDLASCDADFAKFPGLRWINPLASAGTEQYGAPRSVRYPTPSPPPKGKGSAGFQPAAASIPAINGMGFKALKCRVRRNQPTIPVDGDAGVPHPDPCRNRSIPRK